MENSLLFIFDKIWPKTMYYSTVSIRTETSRRNKNEFDSFVPTDTA